MLWLNTKKQQQNYNRFVFSHKTLGCTSVFTLLWWSLMKAGASMKMHRPVGNLSVEAGDESKEYCG